METITNFFSQHLHGIAIAVIATLLVIFGGDINRVIKRLIGKNHFLVRLGIFVLVCALGYGFATILLTEVLTKMLASIPRRFLSISIIGIFILLGLTAERRRQI
ncbi:MAG: DUF3392 family protein [Luteolibacter sp.]